MSIPNYLLNIKSSGIYRFVWDKSQITPQNAETLRLVVGYSEKGPFNTPVYIDNTADFISIYGNISKRLEHKGIFFHRMALQALAAGPILALNVKPFDKNEEITKLSFNVNESIQEESKSNKELIKLYNRNRFWALSTDNIVDEGDTEYVHIVSTDDKDTSCTIFVRKYEPSNYNITIRDWYASVPDEPQPFIEKMLDEKLNQFFMEVYVFRGKYDVDSIKNSPLMKYFVAKDGKLSINPEYKNAFGDTVDALEALSSDSRSNFVSRYRGCTIPYFKDAMGKYISLDLVFNGDYNLHKMLMKFNDAILDDPESFGTTVSLTAEGNDQSATVTAVTNILKCADTLGATAEPYYMEGYTYNSIDKSQGAKEIVKNVLNVLCTDRGLRTALTNRVDVDYHYIIDTFQSFVEPDEGSFNNKEILACIAKEKDNAFAILNFPPMNDFVKSNIYENDILGGFDINKIPQNYQLASEDNGASHCAYYTQLIFSDGTLKYTVPSAALVSNNFMDKWGVRQPYYIVAGPVHGRLTWNGLIGPDYNFGRSDLDVLEPMGVNAIVYVPRKGTYINSNQTAKQNPVSALSKIHIRELVIYLQNEIQSMLENYHWELNTQVLRDTIKTKADAILENIMNNGGVYAYANVCDETNNTPEIIDNEMLILDTHIEPARGAGKMVHNLTIYRTGEMSSSIS